MAKQTFVADAILTAAQMNALQGNDFNQTVSTKTASYVLVASDAGTKLVMNAGATNTTLTVNTSLFAAGDTLTILNISTSGTCTITAGTATVATAGSLALGLNQGGTLYFTSAGVSVFQADGVAATAGGLTFISSTSFTTATSVSLPLGTFSATYANYRVMFQLTSASTTLTISTRYRTAGVDNSTGNYFQMSTGITDSSATSNKVETGGQTSNVIDAVSSAGIFSLNLDVINPQVSTAEVMMQGGLICDTAAQFVGRNINIVFNATTSFDSLSFIASTGTITGTVKVYGYANS